MELQEFADYMGQSRFLVDIENGWKEVRKRLEEIDEALLEDIQPNGLYDIYDAETLSDCQEREKTFKVTNHFGETYALKKSDLKDGVVCRPNLHVELGSVRTERFPSRKKVLQRLSNTDSCGTSPRTDFGEFHDRNQTKDSFRTV